MTARTRNNPTVALSPAMSAVTRGGFRNTVFPIANVLATVVVALSVTMVAPVLVGLWTHDQAWLAFAGAGGISSLLGGLIWVITRGYRRELKIKDGILLVVLTWTILPMIATLPLLLYFDGRLTFTDAYFEMVSSLTTTGATVLTQLDTMPPSVNLWRHLFQWFGGMGIIVLAVAILPLLGVGGMQLIKAETPGPMKDTKLTPRIAQTAKALWLVYVGITAVCVICLRIAGMSWFDALCHAFSAMALGGFSTHDASVGYFNSVPIEVVLSTFQVIAALSFATHFLAWRGKSLRPYLTDLEAGTVVAVLIGASLIAAVYLSLMGTYPTLLQSLRHASFNLITIATDCGYASQDFAQWPAFVPMSMLLLSCVTCSSGSTGGGIKMIRTLTLSRQAMRSMTEQLHPRAVLPLRIGKQVIRNELAVAVLGFTFLYFLCVVGLTFALLISGLDFITAFSAIIACINNMGPGLGAVGPASNYSGLNDVQIWICVFAMILGRLELFPLLVLATRGFWSR